jgi:predicted lipoprotein with Yx(FWY)xxD motif
MATESSLGTILVDGEGHTLYMFEPDAQGPSTCTDQCLGAWPALLGPATAGDGVDAGMLGTAARPDDGTLQVTYNGWPLYYFAQDAAAGDVNGQGVNDVWYVVDPSGAAVGDSDAPAPSSTSDRYGY